MSLERRHSEVTVSSRYEGARGPALGDSWEKLLTVAEPAVQEAERVIWRSYLRAAPTLHAAQAIRMHGQQAEQAYEAVLSEVEEELDRLCARHDYRQMLFVCRMCVGLPVFRRDEPNLNATNLRGQAADRWVLKCGARSLDTDFMRIDESSFSIGDPPESLYRDAIKILKLATFPPADALGAHEVQLPPALFFGELPVGTRGRRGGRGGAAAIGLDCAGPEARQKRAP